MIIIRTEKPADGAAREALLDRAYGTARHGKPSQKLRKGRLPAAGMSLVAADRQTGQIIGTVRQWQVTAGSAGPALLLGPLAVDPGWHRCGIGSALMQRALDLAARRGHRAVLLVGDAAYYGRFGFSAARTARLGMLGQHEPARLLAFELRPGALDNAYGLIVPAGAHVPEKAAAATRRRARARVSFAA